MPDVVPHALPDGQSGGLQLSVDGETWGDRLPAALFGPSVRIVPGETVAADLWVRNTSREHARLELEVSTGAEPGTGLGGWIQVAIDGDPAVASSTWRGPVLSPGQSRRVEIRVHLPAEAPNATRADRATVVDTVRLVSTGSPTSPSPSGPPEPGHPGAQDDGRADGGAGRGLATTGADLTALGALALLLACAGAGALRARRRAG